MLYQQLSVTLYYKIYKKRLILIKNIYNKEVGYKTKQGIIKIGRLKILGNI